MDGIRWRRWIGGGREGIWRRRWISGSCDGADARQREGHQEGSTRKGTDLAALARKWADLASLALIGTYLVYLLQDVVLFGRIFPAGLTPYMRGAAWGLAGLKVLLTLPRWRKLILPLGLSSLYYLSFRQTQYDFLLYLALLTLVCIDLDVRRALRLYVGVAGLMMLSGVLAGLCGAIKVLVYMRGTHVRSAMGLIYPTDAAALLFYIAVAAGILMTNVSEWILAALALGGAGLVYWLNGSFNSTVSFLAYAAALALFRLLKGDKGLRMRLTGTMQVLCSLAYPLLAAGILWLAWRYAFSGADPEKLARWDALLHGRISLAASAWSSYGLTAFGTAFPQTGGGGGTVLQNPAYFFVDSSYPLILIRYGTCLFIGLCLVWCFRTWKLFREGQDRAAIAMTMIALHSFEEHHFPEVHYNILLVLVFADFSRLAVKRREKEEERTDRTGDRGPEVRGRGLAWAVLPLAGILAALSSARVLTWARTVIQVSWLGKGHGRGRLVFLGCALVIVLIFLLLHSLFRLAERRRGRRRLSLALLCLSIAAFCLLSVKGNRILHRECGAHQQRVEEVSDVMDLVVKAAKGRIYVDRYPEYYLERYPGISPNLLGGDDLARSSCATVLVDRSHESMPFEMRGYRYAEVGEHSSLYTNDFAVIEALEAAGFPCYTYYATEHQASLKALAKQNGTPLTEEGLVLSQDHPLSQGPNRAIYMGWYTVTWQLQLPPEALPEEEATPVCTLRVLSNFDSVVGELPLTRANFDAEGKAEIPLAFYTGDCRGIKFPIEVAEGQKVILQRISWARTPG